MEPKFKLLALALVETVYEVGEDGVIEGIAFLAFEVHGYTFAEFMRVKDFLIFTGLVKSEHHKLFPTKRLAR